MLLQENFFFCSIYFFIRTVFEGASRYYLLFKTEFIKSTNFNFIITFGTIVSFFTLCVSFLRNQSQPALYSKKKKIPVFPAAAQMNILSRMSQAVGSVLFIDY